MKLTIIKRNDGTLLWIFQLPQEISEAQRQRLAEKMDLSICNGDKVFATNILKEVIYFGDEIRQLPEDVKTKLENFLKSIE